VRLVECCTRRLLVFAPGLFFSHDFSAEHVKLGRESCQMGSLLLQSEPFCCSVQFDKYISGLSFGA